MTTTEARCPHQLFGEILDGGAKLRVKCNSKFCGHKRGLTVVFHTFDMITGEVIETKRYRDPRRRVDGEQQHG